MAVLRSAETHWSGNEHMAAAALLCGIMCTVLALKFKFSLDLSRRTDGLQETPTVVAGGVYRLNHSEQYPVSSTSTVKHKPISPAKVQLPPTLPTSPPPLPTTPPPTASTQETFNIIPTPLPDVYGHDNTVSENPRGVTHKRIESTDIKLSNKQEKTKLSKKEQKELEKQEKERIKQQKKKDKLVIADILKEDSERIEREAKLLQERQKEKIQEKKLKKTNKPKTEEKTDKRKPDKKSDNLTTEQKTEKSKMEKSKNFTEVPPSNPLGKPVANPLAQTTTPSSNDTLRSNISSNSGPPPYSSPEVTLSESDSSGNTSFAKPGQGLGGTWDLVSQHRQQMQRPVKGPSAAASSIKIDNSMYNVGTVNGQTKDEHGQPRKSLYV